MKILMLFAASAMSTLLVLPTVSQAQTDSVRQQASEFAECHFGGLQRNA